jgi:peptide/nickel transport system ATP-binding protein/oligopeptide transport system ATP-binding protein
MSALIRACGLKKHYGAVKAVDGVSFAVQKDSVFGIVGESGSGKTTIGKCIMGLEPPTAGHIEAADRMQMIFQNPYASFNPALTIGTALREVGSVHKLGRAGTQARIGELLDRMSLIGDVLRRKPKEMSGGQLQRLAIARALMLRPQFIVADEPVSALDVSVQAQVINLFAELKEEYGLTILFISHDLAIVEYICDAVAVVYLGRIVETGPKGEIFGNPLHPYTKALLAARPGIRPGGSGASGERGGEAPLAGEVPNAIDLPAGCRFSPRCNRRITGLCDRAEPEEKEIRPGHFAACHLLAKGPDAPEAQLQIDPSQIAGGTYAI